MNFDPRTKDEIAHEERDPLQLFRNESELKGSRLPALPTRTQQVPQKRLFPEDSFAKKSR